ncbi:hypothetical protein MHYP_G00360020 [Metynnis hypsauchen]
MRALWAQGLIHVLDLTRSCCYWILACAIGQPRWPRDNRRFAERMLLQGRYGFPAPTGRRLAHAAELRNFLPHRRGFQFPLAASEAQQRRNVALAVEAASAPVPTLQRD